jgi:hypothetical protein
MVATGSLELRCRLLTIRPGGAPSITIWQSVVIRVPPDLAVALLRKVWGIFQLGAVPRGYHADIT